MSRLPSGTVTFVFTDIEGSSALWERFPSAMREAVAEHDLLLKTLFTEHGGTIFKTLGDGVACAFEDPAEALAGAVAVQRALKGKGWPEQIGTLRVRMAMHTGNATIRDKDYFGPTLNRAARLIALASGEQILVSSSSAALLRGAVGSDVSLRELGSYRLRDLSLPETTFQVVAPGLRSDFPPIVDVDSRPNNLPHQTSTFVGRDREIAELRELLHGRRIVTIAGMGGIGKTRLALQVASEVIDGFADGAWFVDLSHLTEAALIEQSIAEALGLREVPQEPLDVTVLNHLRNRTLLLIVDNSEHLLTGVARVTQTLTARCAFLSVLTTSREPLHADGEYVYRLGPISDAQSLFLERSHEVSGQTGAQAEAIEALCSKLGNIPLAIELAAARTTLLSVEQLDARLSKSFDLLSTRTAEKERHRTLEATIDWSYRLLDDEEKRLFQSLSIFSGGFTLEACEAIGHVSVPGAWLLDLLQSLVEKSLVSPAATASEPRYEMLDTIAEFARKRSGAPLEDLRRAHFAFYLDEAKRYAGSRKAQDRERALRGVRAEAENCRSALSWALEGREPQCGELLCALAAYWQSRGSLTEGRTWLGRYLDTFGTDDALYPRVLRIASFFAASQDDDDAAFAMSERLREIAMARGDRLAEGEALATTAAVAQRRGDHAQAVALYEQALEIFRSEQIERHSLVVLLNLTNALLEARETARCPELLDEAERLARSAEEDELTALVAGTRGSLALHQGDVDEAERHARAALTLHGSDESGHNWVEHRNLLAEILAYQGRLDEARTIVCETLALSLQSDERNNVIRSFEILAYVLLHEGRRADALRYYGASRHLRRSLNFQSQCLYRSAEFESELRRQTGDAFARAVDEARREPWQALAASLTSR